MNKRILFKLVLLFFLFISTAIGAQVGIGTITPARALEVYAPSGIPPIRFTNLSSLSPNVNNVNLKSIVVDQNGDLWVGRPKGSLLATMVSSLNSNLIVGSLTTDITFDTDDLPATGALSRTGGNFTVLSGGDGLYTFALQPQITTSTASGYITFWAAKNGVAIPNSGVRNSSTGTGDTQVVPLIITLSLVAGDVISFKASCTVSGHYIFEYTAPSGSAPGIPAVIIDVKGYNVF
jgi:hypothetical protein